MALAPHQHFSSLLTLENAALQDLTEKWEPDFTKGIYQNFECSSVRHCFTSQEFSIAHPAQSLTYANTVWCLLHTKMHAATVYFVYPASPESVTVCADVTKLKKFF